jgi:hypothetical protein
VLLAEHERVGVLARLEGHWKIQPLQGAALALTDMYVNGVSNIFSGDMLNILDYVIYCDVQPFFHNLIQKKPVKARKRPRKPRKASQKSQKSPICLYSPFFLKYGQLPA